MSHRENTNRGCVNVIYDALNNYLKYIQRSGALDVGNFVDYMEPYFIKSGYRESEISGNGKILLIVDDGVGDFLAETAVIRETRRLFPTAQIDLLMFSRALDFAKNCPYIDNLYENKIPFKFYPVDEQFKWDMDLVKGDLLSQHYDIAFVFGAYSNSGLIAYMSGAKKRIANPNATWDMIPKEAWCKLVEVSQIAYRNNPVNYVDGKLAILDNFLGIRIADRRIECWCSDDDYDVAQKVIPDHDSYEYIALGIGGSHARKMYPIEKYANLINLINNKDEYKKIKFLIIGGELDKENGERLKSYISNADVENLAGRLTFTQSAAVMSRCFMYIGNDTSTVHIAAAFHIPVLEVNCCSADIFDITNESLISVYYAPYDTLSVVVLPEHGMDECSSNKYGAKDNYGCLSIDHAHCICSILPETVMEGFELLINKINKKEKDVVYIY